MSDPLYGLFSSDQKRFKFVLEGDLASASRTLAGVEAVTGEKDWEIREVTLVPGKRVEPMRGERLLKTLKKLDKERDRELGRALKKK